MGGAPVEKAKNFRASMKRLLAYLAPRRWTLFLVIAMAGGSTAFAIFTPKILGRATTKLFQGIMAKVMHLPGARIDFDYILQIILTVAALYAASAILSYIQQFIMAGVSQRTIYDLRRAVNEKLSRLPLSFYDGRTHGEILSRVTNDLDNIGGTLQQSLTQVITSVATLIGTLVMMLTISPLLTLITIVVVPLALVVTQVIAPRSQKYFKNQWTSLGQLNGHVEEMYTGHVIVKAFGHERRAIERFNETNGRLYDASWRAQFISGLLFPLMSFINNIGYVAVAVVGGIMVTKRVIEIGDIQAFIMYSRQFTMPIAQTANIANLLQSTAASAERVFELLDEKEETPEATGVLAGARGAVRFEDVRFSYKSDVPLIEDLDIAVEPGQAIAIVGPTGAGKTTLVNLLMRFYDVQDGRITVDGTDIRDVRRGNLRCAFGMVLQDTWLFNGTIRDNIAYGRDGVSDEEIHAAAAAAHADHFIRTLPDGYATVLNEEASNISQGQKQLLTIARAILTDPAMLILDEATSSVDTRTEVLIQKAMASLMKGRTSFVIAHRLSTIRDAKLILVMNNGRIVERGTHKELLAKGGFYAELYNSQFTGADIEVDEKAREAEKARAAAEAAARMAARMAAAGGAPVAGGAPAAGRKEPS
ncbi:MAG: ABC transporter ATP-binding protein [Spirochaetes bacterium]|nr:ABC transporter ATP-binding protein [Spirochaetota bacterium]